MESQTIATGPPADNTTAVRGSDRRLMILRWFPPTPLSCFASLGTATLLWLSYFPMAWGWLGWVALVPLLCLIRTGRPAWRVYLAAWVSGLAFFWPVLQWMRVADERMYYTWGALATYCSLYFPLALYLVRRLDLRIRLPLVVTVPVVWTALEFLRAHFLTGFAWYFLGHTQHAFLPVIQVADLGGAYAVTFLVATVNALVFELLYQARWFRHFCSASAEPKWSWRWAIPLQSMAVLTLLGAVLVYGCWRLGQEDFSPGPQVALLQGNLDQRIRNEASEQEADDATRTVDRHYERLARQASTQSFKPDLIVWPETSFPHEWVELSPNYPLDKLPGDWQRAVDDVKSRPGTDPDNWRSLILGWLNENDRAIGMARATRTNVLLGLNATVLEAEGKNRRYNSAVLIHADGRPAGRYDKIHRVPFGEYVPCRDWFPWLDAFAPYDFDYSIRPGDRLTRFPLGDFHFGVIICFEDTDPDLARQYGRPDGDGPAADFLLNISNDGWFNGSSEHEEHLAISRFRAVECRRAVARAVNMGISAVVDGNGRVVALPGPSWAASKKVPAVLTASIPIDHRASLYARWGDWLPWSCWLVLLLGWAGPALRRQRPYGTPMESGEKVR